MEHVWVVEEHDGGHLGAYEAWRCPVCGVSGGPVLPWQERKPWDPFIPGPARKTSKDCGTAQKEIRAYVRLRLEGLQVRRDISPTYASILQDALAYSGEGKTNIMEVLNLIYEIERDSRPTIPRVCQRLIADGFRLP